MSLYKGFAKGASFDPVQYPDKSKKIRDQGLRVMEGMEKEIEHNAEQARLLVSTFEENSQLEAKQRAENFELQDMYAATLAQRKWRNYEIAVNNAKIRQDRKQKDFQALMSLTKSGARLGKMVHDNNVKSADQLAESLQLNYGIGRKAFNAIKGAEQDLINNNEQLQALLRKFEVSGEVPMDVIARIRKSGGYLNFAVEKNSATRFGQNLLGRIGQRSNEEIKLPGYDKPISLNVALEANPALARTVAQELIRLELQGPDGKPRYSTKVMSLAGLTGPQGHVQNVLAHFDQEANEILVKNEFKDRHLETQEVLKSFMGPQNGTAHVLGPQGIDAAIVYFAGGEDAGADEFRYARERVVGALINGLENQTIKWDQVKGLEKYIVRTKGAPKGKFWSDLYEDEWNRLQDAGRKFFTAEEEDLQLIDANQKLEGERFYKNVVNVVTNENPGPDTLNKLLAHTRGRGEHYKKAQLYLTKQIATGQTALNDETGKSILLSRALNGETITQLEIDQFNFSKPVKAQVQALVLKHNQNVPQEGENGTRARLEFAITAKLGTKIKRTNSWYSNTTHKDAEIRAMQLASSYYKSYRELGKSHEDSYTYAVTQIENKIDEDYRNKSGYFNVKSKGGEQYFAGARPGGDFEKPVTLNRKQIAKELDENPNLIFTKQYFDPSEIAESATKGVYREPHRTAMLMQSLSKGKLDAVDIMQAQLQLKRDKEVQEFGAATTPLLPKAYIKRYKEELEKVGPLAQQLLTSINAVDVNKAYVNSGNQIVNQDPYYNKMNYIIEVGDPNSVSIIGEDSLLGETTMINSEKKHGYSITHISLSKILSLMEIGHYERAGSAQWTYEQLKETIEESGLGGDEMFSAANQRKLQNVRIKKYGLNGFDFKEYNEDELEIGESVYNNLNNEKIDQVTYFRSPAACNSQACAWLKKNKPEIYGGLYK